MSAARSGADIAQSQRWAPLTVIVVALSAWSIYAYAVVRVNADILAEAIQVQQWLESPFWVWSYPGQLHGGIVEYPLIALAESMAPGNVYALTLLRVAYIPAAGVLLAICFSIAAPRRSLWPFAIAAAVGPAVLHGFRMISDIYPSAWLLSAAGVWFIFRALSGRTRHSMLLVFGGILVGLGIYQHASAAVFSVPLIAFAVFHWRSALRQLLWIALGGVIGLIPMALAMFAQPDKDVVYRPQRSGAPDIVGALGLSTGDSAWTKAMLPNGLGVAHADSTFLDLGWSVQWWINAVALAALLLVVVVGIALRRSALAAMWLAAVIVVIGLVVVVPPIWYYGTPIGFLLWFSVGFVPIALPRMVEWLLVGALLALSAGFSFAQVWNAHPRFLTGAQVKAEQAAEIEQVASGISDTGIEYVFGDYWEVLPIAYASSGAVHPITYNFNRFPLDPSEVGDEIIVAVTPGTIALPFGHTSWTLAESAEALVDQSCSPIPDLSAKLPEGVSAHLCPTAVLMVRR